MKRNELAVELFNVVDSLKDAPISQYDTCILLMRAALEINALQQQIYVLEDKYESVL